MVWRDDSQLGESRGHAFSSPRLRAKALQHINTYTSVDKTSLHEQTVSRIKWHQTNQLQSRNRPEGPAQASPMQLHCSHVETTRLLSVHSEGEKDTSMQNHSLPYLGPLYSSVLHFWKKESSTKCELLTGPLMTDDQRRKTSEDPHPGQQGERCSRLRLASAPK